MTRGEAAELFSLLFSFFFSYGVCFAAVLLDERFLSPAARDHAWPPASRGAAILGFGPFAVVLHFVRTRPLLPALFVGPLSGAVLGAVTVLVPALVRSLVLSVLDEPHTGEEGDELLWGVTGPAYFGFAVALLRAVVIPCCRAIRGGQPAAKRDLVRFTP